MTTRNVKSAVKKIMFFLTALCSPTISAETAKLAIVIDDIGYHQHYDNAVLAMPKEIAIAVIPSAPYAGQRNRQAAAQGRDMLIHLPMQPLNNRRIEAGGLRLGMSQEDVDQRVGKAKDILPNAIGLNNHMGSAATADTELMTYLMRALAARHLFFLDSRTIGRSVAAKIAEEQGVSALSRHIFLDDNDSYEEVYAQFQKALQYARKHGTAIVIGHPRQNTIAVLRQNLARLPEDVRLIGIGSLWRKEKVVPSKPFTLWFSGSPAPTSVAPFEEVPTLRGVPR